MNIKASKTVATNTPLSPPVESELRHNARVRSIHYSTRIESNKLTLNEAQAILKKKKEQ